MFVVMLIVEVIFVFSLKLKPRLDTGTTPTFSNHLANLDYRYFLILYLPN